MRNKPVHRMIALGLACLLPNACASERVQTQETSQTTVDYSTSVPSTGTYKIGEPYQINGVWYYPHEDYAYNETGVASWYGKDFHGKATANGEIFDMNSLTAAHRTLPLPSVVRVTNVSNGRALVVRVNDRGPFANDRVIDLSRRSAQMLGFEGGGTTLVRLEILADESMALKNQLLRNSVTLAPKISSVPRITVASESLPPLPVSGETLPHPRMTKPRHPPAAVESSTKGSEKIHATRTGVTQPKAAASEKPAVTGKAGTFVMAASFVNRSNAVRLAGRLKDLAPAKVLEQQSGKKIVYRVWLGPLKNGKNPQVLLDKVKGSGFPDARLVVVN
ncbi:MAG: septal ring lytic transglycosylase RlpA family protein [Alphaproteobacteria bacterium]|nr:septal ring lytic transglycosylase RlpA family protein [Alphaproteobacteria bacterium]